MPQPPSLTWRGPADPALGGISIVFPVHNESFIIEMTIRSYHAEFAGRVSDFEIIVAEDGSTDDTKAILERLARELPIRLTMGDQRKGYQRSVIDAIRLASKPWLFVVDSDYQFAAIDFWRLEPYRQTHDVILGWKTPRRDPLYRRVLSWGYGRLLRMFFGVPYHDMDTGFRLFRRETGWAIAPRLKHLTFFTAEFVIRADAAGFRVVEVPVPHYARKIGTTTIFYLSKLAGICVANFVGILRMKREFLQERSKGSRPG